MALNSWIKPPPLQPTCFFLVLNYSNLATLIGKTMEKVVKVKKVTLND
jgi:hypothetical protein